MATFNVSDLGAYIREQRKNAQISLRQLAQLAGVSNPYLSQIERGLRKPSAEILQQIAKALRISAEAMYVQAGILEERFVDSDVPVAVRADHGLTERQKQVLLEIYDSFRRENAERPGQAGEPVSGGGEEAPAPARSTGGARRARRAANSAGSTAAANPGSTAAANPGATSHPGVAPGTGAQASTG